MSNNFERLWRRFINGKTTAIEREELYQLIHSGIYDDKLKDSFTEMVLQEIRKPTSEEEKAILKRIHDRSRPVKPLNPSVQHLNGSSARASNKKPKWIANAAAVIASAIAIIGLIQNAHKENTVDQQILAASPPPADTLKPQYIRLPDDSYALVERGGTLGFDESYGKSTRELTLTGEAFFDVKSHPSAPFIVHTGNVTTTVLGTSFGIRAYPDHQKVVVTVTRGKVKVKDDQNIEYHIEPNEQIEIDFIAHTSVVKLIDAEKELSWKDKYLILDRTTMSEAAKKIAKKYGIAVIISDEKLRNLKFTGGFLGEGDLEHVLKVVSRLTETEYSIQDGVVRIYPAQDKEKKKEIGV